MSESLEFEIDESYLLPVITSSEKHSPIRGKRRTYDPTLFHRGSEIVAKLNEKLRAALALEVRKNPGLFADFNMSLEVKARTKSTPGGYKVLLSLIDVVLGPRGATITQEDCRATVQAMHPEMAVSKDWTKPIPAFALERAKTSAMMRPPGSPVVVKRGMSLRDLHNAVRVAALKASGESRTYRASITIANDAIMINGVRFKLSVNKSNGQEYVFARLNIEVLEGALKS